MKINKAQFRFSTDILRRLGEELNPNPDQGILELVKNSYDADSIDCIIEFKNTNLPGGIIHILDDGDGMDLDGIKNGWLLLGKSPKNIQKKTKMGRTPAGSKGLGRLAALRMGKIVKLITRPISNPSYQYEVEINWSLYDETTIVEDVEVLINESRILDNKKHGTEIFIKDLRIPIQESNIKNLARNVILLADPFLDNPIGFNPVLKAPDFKYLEDLVKRRYFSDAEFHLEAEVNNKGISSANIFDWKGKTLFTANHSDLTAERKNEPYKCPSAKFDLWIYLLNATSFSARSSTIGEVRKWLKEFGGVHLYENDLRVAPYGNPGNDWLEMNLSRARSPEERPSTNTVIGRVIIFNSDNTLLQKTDRSGYIEDDAFNEIKCFAQDSLEWLASRRMELARDRREKEKKRNKQISDRTRKKIDEVVNKAPEPVRSEIQKAVNAYKQSKEKEIRDLKKEVQLYRTLSTAGITAATFAHESSGNPIKTITLSIKTIERRTKNEISEKYDSLLKKPIESIKKSIDSLSVLGSATLSLIEHEKRRTGRVDLNSVIMNILEILKPFLSGRDVEVITDFCVGNPYLQGTEAAIESIITNLINNSLAAFESINVKQRKLLIITSIEEDIYTLRVIDNGPGIRGISLRDIWIPGKSTRRNGTGLGLSIVKDTVIDLGGEVDAKEKSDLGGAEFIISLPIVGVDYE